MRLLAAASCIFALSAVSFGEQPTVDDTLGHLALSAEKEMTTSIQELSQLREQIAAEKLPLAQELTTLEEQLTQWRRHHDKVTRLVDAANLEIPTIRAEIKARQDELTYVSNLLDEYARSFESKVNISELQYCGEAMENAKQVTGNAALSMPETYARQTGFVLVSLKRLFDAVEGLRFPGVAVDLQGSVIDGQFAIIGPVALFSSRSGGTSGLAIPQTGSTKPLVRPLEGPMQAGVALLVDHGEGTLPLDPTRGGALKAMVHRTSMVEIFKKGGPIMWPLLVAAVLALLTVLERAFFLLNERRKRDPRAVEQFFSAVDQGVMQEAVRIGEASRFFVVRALGYALAHMETSLTHALLYAQEKELKRFRQGIPILDTVITSYIPQL